MRGASHSFRYAARSAPMPRRGGFTTMTSGTSSGDCARAHAVASSAIKDAAERDRPAWRAALMAEEIAPEDTSTPVTRGNPARAQARAKPPTPQYRSHRLSGRRPSAKGCEAHSAACS